MLNTAKVSAQEKVQGETTKQNSIKSLNIMLDDHFPRSDYLHSDTKFTFDTFNNYATNEDSIFLNQSIFSQKIISFIQLRSDREITGLGATQWFNNRLNIKASDQITFDIEAGLAIQNTIQNPFIPNYQYTIGASINYNFTDNLSAYIFGQFVSKPFNKPEDYFDAFSFNNSLFLQSGTGIGIKTSFKNTLIDFQIRSNANQLQGNFNTVNPKLKIQF